MTYINAIKYLMSLPDASVQDSFASERIKVICESFDSPQKRVKAIHICGNVGKNSCMQMLYSVLKEAGYYVGCYNPYETDLRKIITLSGEAISHDEFADIVKMVSLRYARIFPNIIPERIEILFIVALIFFAKYNCDIALFEKSIQNHDASNMTQAPLLTVITPFSSDQESSAKFVDVIKRGTRETVSSPQHKNIYNSISDACASVGSRLTIPIYSELEIEKISLFKTFFKYRGESYSVKSFSPCQTVNAITSIESAKALTRVGMSIKDEAIKKGIANAPLTEKCEAISMDPSIILSSSYENDRIDTVFASLAQVKELIHSDISVFIDSSIEIDEKKFVSELESYEIGCQNFVYLPKSENGKQGALESEVKKYIKSIRNENSFDKFALFIGTNEFTHKIREIIQLNMGNF